jgi:alpha-beta hydrolase superfamily lysophospholipase
MKTLLTALLISLSLAAPVNAESSSQEDLLKAVSAKETMERIPPQHRSRISFSPTPTCKTLLMFHGLYESPYYLKGLTKYFVSRGFNVVSLLLSGHFVQNDPRMQKFSYKNWRQDAITGLEIAKKLSEQVYVFGYSTGGTMAADLALHYPQEIAGLFLFAPALDISTRTKVLVQTGTTFQFFPSEACNAGNLNAMCKVAGILSAGSVSKAQPLLQEGLSWSPYAGVQVHRYIGALLNEFKTSNASDAEVDATDSGKGNIHNLTDVYSKIRAPTFLVLAENDLTISTPLAKRVFKNLPTPKDLIVYSDADGIAHTNITKYREDAFQGSPNFYNHFTPQLESRMDRFIGTISPACKK